MATLFGNSARSNKLRSRSSSIWTMAGYLCLNNQLVLTIVLSTLLLGIVCFNLGRNLGTRSHLPGLHWLQPQGDVEVVFEYQPQYAEETNPAQLWLSLFPVGGGFIQHPEVSPQPACLSVYHQLHCLDILRQGYWAAREGKDSGHHGSPAHIRHCIDYLRQSLICHADSNLEPVIRDGGVSGFGNVKTCRNLDQVATWAARWAWSNSTTSSHAVPVL